MKKLLLSLAALMIATSAFATEESYEIEFKNAANNSQADFKTDTEISLFVETGSEFLTGILETEKCSYGMYGLKIGQNKNPGSITLGLAADAQVTPTKIVIEASANKNGAGLVFKFNDETLEPLEDTDKNDTYKTYTLTDFSAALESLKFERATSSKEGFIFVHRVTVYYDGASDTRLTPEVSFPEDAYSVNLSEAELFESPVVTTDSDGTVSYSSSKTDVATVDEQTGAVTILADGVTVISANVAATEIYRPGSASYTLTVIDNTLILSSPLGEDFTFENVEGEDYPWSHDSRYGLKGSGYISGAVVATEGIAVSPVIDLKNREDATISFKQAFNNYKVDGQMISVEDFDGYAYLVMREVENDVTSDWSVIENGITAPASFSWTFYPNDELVLTNSSNKKIQIGFKYVSTAECAGTWEIQDITVNAQVGSGIQTVQTESEAPEVYYNLQGVRVAQPQSGLYIVVKGNTSRKVLVK